MKSPLLVPVMPMEVMLSAALPVLLSVTICAALIVPTPWLAKVRLVADKLTIGAGAVPVPVKVTVCGLPVALSVMLTAALRVPVALGTKVTLMVQLAFAARVEGEMGQLFD